MNILFLSTRSPYPLISGHSLRTYHILRGAALSHRVNFLTFLQLDCEADQKNRRHLESFCASVEQFPIPVDQSKIRLGASLFSNLFSRLPFVAEKYDSILMRQKIREILSKEKIDLVHVDLLPLSVYLDQFPHIPKILVNHNVESLRLYRWFRTERNPLKKLYLGIQHKKLRKYEITSMERYDACVVVSEKDKEILRGMGVKSRIFTVPNGTDTQYFKPSGEKVTRNSILWIGHMDVHTNRDAVLYFWREIFPLIRKSLPEVNMTFVGTSPPKEIATASQSDKCISATGFVDDIRPYLAKAAVVVVPIRIGSGTRLKILDAMGMKKAIVSTSVGCEGLRVTHGENILIGDSPDDFAGQVIRALKDDDLRNRLEENARRLAMEYDWSRQCALQEEVYQYAIGCHGAA